MSYSKKITVLGGDRRQTAVADFFARRGYEVTVWGLPPDTVAPTVRRAKAWHEAVCETDVLILPLPTSPDSRHLNMPPTQEESVQPPLVLDVLDLLPPHTLVAGGRLSPAHKEALKRSGRPFFDYFES